MCLLNQSLGGPSIQIVKFGSQIAGLTQNQLPHLPNQQSEINIQPFIACQFEALPRQISSSIGRPVVSSKELAILMGRPTGVMYSLVQSMPMAL